MNLLFLPWGPSLTPARWLLLPQLLVMVKKVKIAMGHMAGQAERISHMWEAVTVDMIDLGWGLYVGY